MKPTPLLYALPVILVFGISGLRAERYPEVVFANSRVGGVYAGSQVEYSGRSWVENLHKHLLVSDTLFFTPGNALSLRYKSDPDGRWQVDLRYDRQKTDCRPDRSDFLMLRLYVETEHTEKKDLPKIGIRQPNGETDRLDMASFVEAFGHGEWLHVRIPAAKFRNLTPGEPIRAVSLYQNGTGPETHRIFIDQVEFLPKKTPAVKLSSPAVLSSATAFDRHVRLQWQLPLTPSIRYIKIYRSEDGGNFVPVDIRPVTMQGCLDAAPTHDRTYRYKITWVDYDYAESPFSEVKEVKTGRLDDDSLLDLVQHAHVDYFVDHHDVNSGMYLPVRRKDKVVVSVRESGYAVLSLLVGVERGRLGRQAALSRMSKMARFLAKAQNRHGFFPPYFDGRTGLPERPTGEAYYDVAATACMIEALLVARQYFGGTDAAETDFRNRVTELWESVRWDKALADDYGDVLLEKITAVDDSTARIGTLGGINRSMNAYMLAMASPRHGIPPSAYENGVKRTDGGFGPIHPSVALPGDSLRLMLHPLFRISLDLLSLDDSTQVRRIRASVLKDTTVYGERLPFGYGNTALPALCEPFLTIDPSLLADAAINYREAVQKYANVSKRRDNEAGTGSSNSEVWGIDSYGDSVAGFRISPAIAPASIFVLPEVGKRAILALYRDHGAVFFTEHGFKGWIDLRNHAVSDEYFAHNQAAIALSMENARSGLIWRLYAGIPEIKKLTDELFPSNRKKKIENLKLWNPPKGNI